MISKNNKLFLSNERKWNKRLITDQFLKNDADAILALNTPQRSGRDKVAWIGAHNGIYNAKSGYHYWFGLNYSNNTVHQSVGWKKVWHLKLPHKVKVFIWRFCRNVIPVRWRLCSRGVQVPTTCPMCLNDIEHMLHLFFDCNFATDCWKHVNLRFNWNDIEDANAWLLHVISSAPTVEVMKICIVLWGIWRWRNQKVWEGKVVTPAFAMDSSFSMYREWSDAKKRYETKPLHPINSEKKLQCKWQRPEAGSFKINVDASVFPGAKTFSVGMVLRDHSGSFLAAKNICFPAADSVFEAEVVGIREALSWVKDLQLHEDKVLVESDSLLSVKAIMGEGQNFLEVGDMINDCKLLRSSMNAVEVCFVRRNANRVAHEVARIPCLANSSNFFTSPPTCLLEAISFDLAK